MHRRWGFLWFSLMIGWFSHLRHPVTWSKHCLHHSSDRTKTFPQIVQYTKSLDSLLESTLRQSLLDTDCDGSCKNIWNLLKLLGKFRNVLVSFNSAMFCSCDLCQFSMMIQQIKMAWTEQLCPGFASKHSADVKFLGFFPLASHLPNVSFVLFDCHLLSKSINMHPSLPYGSKDNTYISCFQVSQRSRRLSDLWPLGLNHLVYLVGNSSKVAR